MKKILVILSICAVVFAGCVKKDTAFENAAEKVLENEAENVSVTQDEPVNEKKKLTSEETAEIYMSQKEMWQYSEENSPMQGYGYCLLDLDFDGVCELIRNVNNGSGRFSYNEYFKIDSERGSVEKIPTPQQENDDGYDYYMFDDDLKLLMSASDNSWFYLCKNMTRVTLGIYAVNYGMMYMGSDGISTQPLFWEYHDEREENPEAQEHLYNVKIDDETKDVDKETYDRLVTEFYSRNYDADMKWQCIDGLEFDSADELTQKQMLIDACDSFGYSKFFYD